MKFINPAFLFALFAIAIPILIHLFSFRKYKKIFFPNVSFLKEVKQEKQSKSKLKHLLILLSRILAISFLVLAFAQPYIPLSNNNINYNNTVVIYIDNSFSMDAIGEQSSLLNEAKQKAIEIINSYSNSTNIALVTNNFSSNDNRFYNKKEVVDLVEKIDISPNSKLASNTYSRAISILNNEEKTNKTLYYISDFQKTTFDYKSINEDTLINTVFVPLKAQFVNNIFIDSLWSNSPVHQLNQLENINVRVKNINNENIENIPLKLYINNELIALSDISINANSSNTTSFNYINKIAGTNNCKITLADNTITKDDVFYFSYEIARKINILIINQESENKSLHTIFNVDSLFNITNENINQLNANNIKNNQLIILNEVKEISSGFSATIKQFVENGGSLLVFPPEDINFDSYRDFLVSLDANYFQTLDTSSLKVSNLNYQHQIFTHVFEGKQEKVNLPLVKKHFSLSSNQVNFSEDILSFLNNSSFLKSYNYKKGKVYLCASPLNKSATNFAEHAIFVPIVYNIALYSLPKSNLYYIIGDENTVPLKTFNNESVFHLRNEKIDVIPKMINTNAGLEVLIKNEIETSGNYILTNNNISKGISFNYNRAESDVNCYSFSKISEDLNSNLKNFNVLEQNSNSFSSSVNEVKQGKNYWKLCIILALLFLAIEIVLIKIFK